MITNISKNWFFQLSVVYFIAVLIRCVALLLFMDDPRYILNDSFVPIFSPDPALYGYHVKLLLSGGEWENHYTLIEALIYSLTFIGFDLDGIMLYAPVFLAPLVMLPVALIVRLMGYPNASLIAALLASFGYGYYSRTYIGYFDTDVLNLFFPMMAVFALMAVEIKKQYLYGLLAAVMLWINLMWYHSAEPLTFAIIAFYGFYVVTFGRGTIWHLKTILFLVAVILPVPVWQKSILLAFSAILFWWVRFHIPHWISALIAVVILVAGLYYVDLSIIEFHLKRYFQVDEFFGTKMAGQNLHFLAPMLLVAEAKASEWYVVFSHISGNVIGFILAMTGLIWVVVRRHAFLLLLPMLGLGIFAIWAGIRFHIYATPVAAIGVTMLGVLISEKISKVEIKRALVTALFLFTLLSAYHSLVLWNNKAVKPYFSANQVDILNQLASITNPGDYAVTWWDYGWPLWYYTGLKTMIDNGKHYEDNYVVSRILTEKDQKRSALFAKVAYEEYAANWHDTAMVRMIEKYKDMDSLFKSIENNQLNPANSVDKYLILPYQMLEIYANIALFSDIDLKQGYRKKGFYYVFSQRVSEDKQYIYLENNQAFEKEKALLHLGKDRIPVKDYFVIRHMDGRKGFKHFPLRKNGAVMIDYDGFYLIMDPRTAQSTFIQLFVFDNPEEKYFHSVYSGREIKIYRIK